MKLKVSKRGISSLYFKGEKELAEKIHELCSSFPHREIAYDKKKKVKRKEIIQAFAYYVLELSPKEQEEVVSFLRKVEREKGVVLLPSSEEEDLLNKF